MSIVGLLLESLHIVLFIDVLQLLEYASAYSCLSTSLVFFTTLLSGGPVLWHVFLNDPSALHCELGSFFYSTREI